MSKQEVQIGNQRQMLAKLGDITSILNVHQSIPPQILLSKAVVFLDARGRYFGFHVEWINSREVKFFMFAF